MFKSEIIVSFPFVGFPKILCIASKEERRSEKGEIVQNKWDEVTKNVLQRPLESMAVFTEGFGPYSAFLIWNLCKRQRVGFKTNLQRRVCSE